MSEAPKTHSVQPLVLRWSLQNTFNNTLQLIDGGGLLGICEDCGLVTPDH